MFKKLIVAIVCLATILLCAFVSNRPVFEKFSSEFIVYLSKNSSNANFINSSKLNYPFISNRFGECFTSYDNEIDIQSIIDEFSAQLVFCESTDYGESYYFYSKEIKYLQLINGNKVNLHIFVGKDKIKIGSPIIYDSY